MVAAALAIASQGVLLLARILLCCWLKIWSQHHRATCE
jgi:hypothetical protein